MSKNENFLLFTIGSNKMCRQQNIYKFYNIYLFLYTCLNATRNKRIQKPFATKEK